MACQTGIRANEKLREVFENAKQSKLRLVKVVVRNEELSPNYEYRGTDDWKKDWKATLPECVDSFEPCFVLFRLGGSHEWLLITFADDRAPTKEKMLLAATRATFKSEFGQSYIQHERHVVDRKDLTLDNQEEWLASKRNRDDRPLTEIEQELVSHAFFDSTWQVNAQQERISAIHAPNPLALRGVAFPIDRDAEDAIRSVVDGRLAFVQLSVDTLNEAIKLEAKEPTLAADQLASRIPRDKPRYQFYRFEHSFEDQLLSSIVFIYSLPSSGSSIKERMLYSSCKSPFLDAAQRGLGVELSKKIELDPREVLSEQALMDYLHPAASAPSAAFARPAPPARGGRRITKA